MSLFGGLVAVGEIDVVMSFFEPQPVDRKASL